jgi:hypothetical protein
VRKISPPNLLAEHNRGLLLDVFVFFLNLVLMMLLANSPVIVRVLVGK